MAEPSILRHSKTHRAAARRMAERYRLQWIVIVPGHHRFFGREAETMACVREMLVNRYRAPSSIEVKQVRMNDSVAGLRVVVNAPASWRPSHGLTVKQTVAGPC
jgi:hypothetical protein